jgi:hypothetical protein
LYPANLLHEFEKVDPGEPLPIISPADTAPVNRPQVRQGVLREENFFLDMISGDMLPKK